MKLIELKMTPAQIKRAIQYGWGAAAISAVTGRRYCVAWLRCLSEEPTFRRHALGTLSSLSGLVLPTHWLPWLTSSEPDLLLLLCGGCAWDHRPSSGGLIERAGIHCGRRLTSA
jgi:hypothetical protein